MSKPENPLARFRSYSYHHILLACSTSGCADALDTLNADPNAEDGAEAFVRSNDVPKTLKEKLTPKNAGDGKYVILIDGRVDTDFVIRNVNWSAMVAANIVSNDKFTSIIYEGKMTIEEPRGVQFFNMMNTTSDVLEVEPNGIIFVLKTIFVGHTDEIQEGDEVISYVHPLHMILYDVKGTFDVTGGVYNLEFTTLKNGAADLPKYTSTSEEVGINLSKKNTLVEAFNQLEVRLNAIEQNTFDCIQKQNPDKKIRYKKFKIVVETPYDDARYVCTDLKPETKEEGKGGPTFVVGKASTVRFIINMILDLSERVKEEMRKEHKSPRIESKVEMFDDREEITFRVFQKSEVTDPTDLCAQQNIIDAVVAGSDDPRIEKNLLELNYMYTGLNTDIVNLDLKMEMGLAFMMMLRNADGIISPKEEHLKGMVDSSRSTMTKGLERCGEHTKKFTPGSTPTRRDGDSADTLDSIATMRYQAAFSQFTALEGSGVAMVAKIHGNPSLMNSVNHGGGGEVSSGEKVMPDWTFHPGLAVVNIRMPTNDEDDVNSYTERFWYDGVYSILQIDTYFDSGLFTQDLHLLALPKDLSLLEKKDGQPNGGEVSCTATDERPTVHDAPSETKSSEKTTPPSPESLSGNQAIEAIKNVKIGGLSESEDQLVTAVTQSVMLQVDADSPSSIKLQTEALSSGDLSVGMGLTGVPPNDVIAELQSGNSALTAELSKYYSGNTSEFFGDFTSSQSTAFVQKLLHDSDSFNVLAGKTVMANYITQRSVAVLGDSSSMADRVQFSLRLWRGET